jgi:DNA-3-methyladenine glycosylase
MNPLPRPFYTRPPDTVAQELIGKILVRTTDEAVMSGIIVETEAYFGDTDPASRAYNGKKKYNAVMFETPGRLFIYMVHGWWLLNVVAHRRGEPGAVLIRALEPLEGLEVMSRNRPAKNKVQLTSGPGKLTRALDVTKELNGIDVTSPDVLSIVDHDNDAFDLGTSHRIGVTRDLPRELRFYLKGNRYVSL